MAVEVIIPAVGESITEVVIGRWLKAEGDPVQVDEPLAEIETDKVTFELPAPVAGVLATIKAQPGETLAVGAVAAMVEEGAGAAAAPAAPPQPAASEAPTAEPEVADDRRISPAAKRLLAEHGLDAAQVPSSGPGDRLLKEDVLAYLEAGSATPDATPAEPAPVRAAPPAAAAPVVAPAENGAEGDLVPLSPLRRRVAERLVQASSEMAMLTTFNEADMTAVMGLRRQWQDTFVSKYGIKLGFMSFFVKAVIEALKTVPGVNAEWRGDSILYHQRYDIGVAIGGGRGLVVPVIRNADCLSFAEVEQTIADFAQRAQSGALQLEELSGGTFTISNGGVYGSLLSTPIINPPQCGILGLHAIQDRPVAREGQVVIRPMMYLALSYDHRLVDGREAVTFLRRIKEVIEDPARLFLEV